MGGDATENVESRHQVIRKCHGEGNTQAQSMCMLQRAYGPWRGRGRAGPGTARPQPALRFSECSVRGHIQRRRHYCPRTELLMFPQRRRLTRVVFSPSAGAYPDIFRPLLELSTFPAGWRPTRVGFSPSPGAYPDTFRPLPEQLTFPSGQAAYPWGIFPEGWCHPDFFADSLSN